MGTIRFARHHPPKDETKSAAESFLVLDCRLPAKADDVALAFGQPR
jgi:hypothetical protein